MYANSRWALFHPELPRADAVVSALGRRATASTRSSTSSRRGSTLLRNNGDGTFTDVSDAAGIRDAQWGWAAEFLDYNNDGRLDIYDTNGFDHRTAARRCLTGHV